MKISKNKYLIEALYAYSASNHFMITQINPSPVELLNIIKNASVSRLAFKAAWALEHRLINNLTLCITYFDEIASLFMFTKNWSVLRSLSKILHIIAINNFKVFENKERLLTTYFEFIENRECPIAVRCNIYDILLRYCSVYPEICQEVKLRIEFDLVYINSAALLSRGKRVLQKLERIS